MKISITLSKLLESFLVLPTEMDKKISHLTLDSRAVGDESLFFACKGTHQDGRDFLDDAIQKGVSAILMETDNDEIPFFKNNIPIVCIKNLKAKISTLASIFYQNPSSKLRVIGITGTNGKTSCSHFIAGALHSLKIPCGIIGTIGNGIYGEITPSTLTTPDAISLQKLFANFVEKNVKTVVMEVSSHSLDQGRVNNVPFEIAIFTNLTRDHLDYHGSMENYGAAKKRLFKFPSLKSAIINVDDEFGRKLKSECSQIKNLYGYSLEQNPAAEVFVNNVKYEAQGLAARVSTPWGKGSLQTSLVGQFNISNVLAVLSALNLLDISFEESLEALTQLKPVTGRMQTLGGNKQPLIVIDYAHTPDALEKVLGALKQQCEGKLYCLFGCGGDRDKGKRPIMAKIAEKYADFVMVTDDNPRHEEPGSIISDIMQGFKHPDKIIIQHDRSKAIQEIIQWAKLGDCVLIAGKGAETYQQIGDEKIPFNDFQRIKEVLASSQFEN